MYLNSPLQLRLIARQARDRHRDDRGRCAR